MDEEKEVFKILAIDGGGVKGLYSSTILEHLEDKFEVSISDYFDMICGTSTGGLLALALSLKIPTKEISDIYLKEGKKIFPDNNKILAFIKQIFWKGKYSEGPLKQVLFDVFGERKLEQSNNLLCIPSFSITDARPWVFKYDHKEGELGRDNKAKYVDVALATSAAPTYFPIAEIEYYDSKQFIDGGVWANNPTLVGLIEALTYYVGEGKKFDKIKILSLSSLTNTGGKPTGLKRDRAFIHWKEDLFETSLTGQSLFSNYFMNKIKDISEVEIEYVRIPSANISSEQERHVKLDLATKKALELIRGKGNDMGEIYKKKREVETFFLNKKKYNLK
jgi:patatin-like phospholipase/acyl hydrolase